MNGQHFPLTPQADSVSANTTSPKVSPPVPRWRLWVDGCGGFLLLTGNRWTVGGLGTAQNADVCVRADWPRLAGSIERAGSDYFWSAARSKQQAELITGDRPIPIEGSATLSLHQPSPLCNSALLMLQPPHRFDEHVDAVLLVGDSLLIGPTADCHIRSRDSVDRAVLTKRGDQWLAKAGLEGDFEELCPGKRTMLRTLAMTLEEA